MHYSLPKEEEKSGRCDRDKNQGTVVVTVRNEPSIDEYELRRVCERYGVLKGIFPCRDPE